MPAGGNFTGVWFSPQYGKMELVQTQKNVIGTYVAEQREGRIEGVVYGNLLRFQWHERKEMIEGMPQTTRGRGFFRYVIDADGDHKLIGSWGHDSNDSDGGPWNAVKSQRLSPQVVSPDASQGAGTAKPQKEASPAAKEAEPELPEDDLSDLDDL